MRQLVLVIVAMSMFLTVAAPAGAQDEELPADAVYLSATDLYYSAGSGELIDPNTGSVLNSPFPAEAVLEYQSLAERAQWGVPTEVRDAALALVFEEISLLVELDAFTSVRPQLSLVHRALPPATDDPGELIDALIEADSSLAELKGEILGFGVPRLGPAEAAMDDLSTVWIDSLRTGAEGLIPPDSHVAALSMLVSAGASAGIPPHLRGVEFLALAPKLEMAGGNVAPSDRFPPGPPRATAGATSWLPWIAFFVGVALVLLVIRVWQRHLRSVEELAFVDDMTALWNRRRLDQDLTRTMTAAENGETPVAFAMVDVDHFKTFNDTHGHSAGDEALREVASTIASSVREGDVVYRYGGEEFSILLPDTTELRAVEVAERVRRAVEAKVITGQHTQPGGTLTVSVGVSALVGSSPGAITASADKALYAAKRSGRNTVSASVAQFS